LQKGINAWCYPPSLSLKEVFSATKEAGFDTIELNMTEKSKNNIKKNFVDAELNLSSGNFLTTDFSSAEIQAIKAMSQTFNIPISSISTSLHWDYPLNSINEAMIEKGKNIAFKMIQACSLLGGDTILVVPGVVTEENDYENSYEKSREAIKAIGKYAQKMNIKVGIENVWNKFLLSPLEMKKFIDEINNPNVGLYFDAGNVLQFGYPEQWVKILGEKIFKVHVKDFRKDIGNIHGFTNLLQGDINWKKLMWYLKGIKYQGPLTCELEPYRENPVQLAVDTSHAMDYLLSL
jgi:hexulose-6-phosphate isomerase